MNTNIKNAISAGKKLMREALDEEAKRNEDEERRLRAAETINRKRIESWIEHSLPEAITRALAAQEASPMGCDNDLWWVKELSHQGEVWSFRLYSEDGPDAPRRGDFPIDLGSDLAAKISSMQGLAAVLEDTLPASIGTNYVTHVLHIAFVYKYNNR